MFQVIIATFASFVAEDRAFLFRDHKADRLLRNIPIILCFPNIMSVHFVLLALSVMITNHGMLALSVMMRYL